MSLYFRGSSFTDNLADTSFALDNGAAVDGGEDFLAVYWNHVTTADKSTSSVLGGGGANLNCHCPWSDSNLYFDRVATSSSGRISTSYASYLDKWTHVGLYSRHSGTVRKEIYLDGVSITSSGTIAASTSNTSGLTVGANTYQSRYHKGRVARFAIFKGTITQAEADMIVTATASGVDPMRVGRPYRYYPIYGYASPEPDLSGNGANATVNGAATQQADPPAGRLVHRKRPFVLIPAAGGGGGGTIPPLVYHHRHHNLAG